MADTVRFTVADKEEEIKEKAGKVETEKEEKGERERAEEEKNPFAGVYRLKRAIRDDEGNKIKEITYDFDAVKPIQYRQIVAQVQANRSTLPMPEINLDVQISLFSKAAGISASTINTKFSIADLQGVARLARNFLLGIMGETDEEDEEET